jgi:hypothetical protein
MLVRPLESLQRSSAVISLGVDSGLAGPIFFKFLKLSGAFKSLSFEILHSKRQQVEHVSEPLEKPVCQVKTIPGHLRFLFKLPFQFVKI